MKKKVNLLFFIGIVLSLILLGKTGAVGSNLRESYAPKETIIAELSGNILNQISLEQIKVLRLGHVEVPFEGGVEKINERYYIWIVAPQNIGNYTLKIERIETTVSGNPTIVNYQKDFSIAGELIDYSIKPGAISSSKDFVLNVELYKDEEQAISTDFPVQREINLVPGNNQIYFSISEIRGTQFLNISLGNYVIPAFIIGNRSITEQINNETNIAGNANQSQDNQTVVNVTGQNIPLGNQSVTNITAQNTPYENRSEFNKSYASDFDFNVQRIRATALRDGKKPSYGFGITNKGNWTINDLVFEYDSSKFEIEPRENITIEPNETAIFNLTVKNTNLSFAADIVSAYSGKKAKYMLVSIKFTKNDSEVKTTYLGKGEKGLYCSEISGTICTADETCDGQYITTLDANGRCCTGNCGKSESGGSSWIGYLIAGIIVVALLILYLKYRKTGNVKNPLQKRVSEIEGKQR